MKTEPLPLFAAGAFGFLFDSFSIWPMVLVLHGCIMLRIRHWPLMGMSFLLTLPLSTPFLFVSETVATLVHVGLFFPLLAFSFWRRSSQSWKTRIPQFIAQHHYSLQALAHPYSLQIAYRHNPFDLPELNTIYPLDQNTVNAFKTLDAYVQNVMVPELTALYPTLNLPSTYAHELYTMPEASAHTLMLGHAQLAERKTNQDRKSILPFSS